MLEYTVAVGHDYGDNWSASFSERVSNLLKEGWTPQGGVSVIQLPGHPLKLYQAFIREVEVKLDRYGYPYD